MQLKTLTVSGFRSLKHDIKWQPGNLNILIGPNGSGKSNILRTIDLLAASAQGRLDNMVRSAGGIEPLLWDGSAEAIELMVDCTPTESFRNPLRESLTYKLKLDRNVKSSDYRIGFELLGNYHQVRNGQQAEPFKFLESDGRSAKIFDENHRSLTAPQGTIPEFETLLSLAADPFSQNRVITAFRAQMASWNIYHDFNTGPESAVRKPAVTRLERRVAADGQNLIPVLHTLYTGDRDFKREINAAMAAAFGDDFEELVFAPAADQRIGLRVRWRSLRREQSAADLSDGTLRFLFLLTVLASPDAAPVIAIDEPESGLHPSMERIIAEFAVAASANSQIILATHSPHLLDAFSRCDLTTTVVKWSDGTSRLTTLPQDQLAKWLEHYTLGDLHRSGELEGLAT